MDTEPVPNMLIKSSTGLPLRHFYVYVHEHAHVKVVVSGLKPAFLGPSLTITTH